MTKEQEQKIRQFAIKRHANSDIAHGFDHIECVVNMAKKIAIDTKAKLHIVIPAAYLHDIVSRKEVDSFDLHTENSTLLAREFLSSIGFSEQNIDEICSVIIESSYESYLRGIEPKTLEAKIVRDADWIDAMGARGIARVFVFAGYYRCPEIGKVEMDPERPDKLVMSTSGPDPSPIYHFFSKLLWLKDLMQTETGKKEAEIRHQFMIDFLKQYKSECNSITDIDNQPLT
ncbi:MAG: HD domain-containing protein [bacterium]